MSESDVVAGWMLLQAVKKSFKLRYTKREFQDGEAHEDEPCAMAAMTRALIISHAKMDQSAQPSAKHDAIYKPINNETAAFAIAVYHLFQK